MIVTQGGDIQKLQIGNYGSAPIEFFTDNTARVTITTAGNVDMTGALNVDPTNAGQINCMYVNAGNAIGGNITTDTFYVNQTITNVNTGLGTISFNDGDNSPSFLLDAESGLTLYASFGSPGGGDYPAAQSAIFSCPSRYDGVINVWRLNVDNGGIVSPGNAKKPGIESPQTGLFLWQYFR
jgi:hypothetical protein